MYQQLNATGVVTVSLLSHQDQLIVHIVEENYNAIHKQ